MMKCLPATVRMIPIVQIKEALWVSGVHNLGDGEGRRQVNSLRLVFKPKAGCHNNH